MQQAKIFLFRTFGILAAIVLIPLFLWELSYPWTRVFRGHRAILPLEVITWLRPPEELFPSQWSASSLSVHHLQVVCGRYWRIPYKFLSVTFLGCGSLDWQMPNDEMRYWPIYFDAHDGQLYGEVEIRTRESNAIQRRLYYRLGDGVVYHGRLSMRFPQETTLTYHPPPVISNKADKIVVGLPARPPQVNPGSLMVISE